MKRAVITGATGGIGSKTAEVLGQAGYEVIVTGINEAGRDTVMSNLKIRGLRLTSTSVTLPMNLR